jgi:hypothetical protein
MPRPNASTLRLRAGGVHWIIGFSLPTQTAK